MRGGEEVKKRTKELLWVSVVSLAKSHQAVEMNRETEGE